MNSPSITPRPLSAKLQVGNKTVKVAGTARATLKKGKKKTVTIKLGKAGKKLAKSCGKPKLTVTSTTKSGKKQKQSGKTKRTLKKSASLCGPKVVPVPSTIDLTTAERCDFITEGADPRTECLFPYPNNYFTKADSSTDTGLRLDLQRDSMPANQGGTHINPADLNLSDGFSPGAPIITQVPGLDNQTARTTKPRTRLSTKTTRPGAWISTPSSRSPCIRSPPIRVSSSMPGTPNTWKPASGR